MEMVLAFLTVISPFKPLIYLHEIRNWLECQSGSQHSLILVPQWGELHARWWGHSNLLARVGTVCPWWAKVALSSQPHSGFSCGPAPKNGTKVVLMPTLTEQTLGQGSKETLSASLFPDTALSSTSAFRNWVNVSHWGRCREKRYVMPGVKVLTGMSLGSYEMEMNFSGCFILMTVLIIVLSEPMLAEAKELASNVSIQNPFWILHLSVRKDLCLKWFCLICKFAVFMKEIFMY